jgi:enediyne biosynthesis protein E4
MGGFRAAHFYLLPFVLIKFITVAIIAACGAGLISRALEESSGGIRFELKTLPVRLENDQTTGYNAPETMPGGVAVFDYNHDGRPDIFLTNGADIATLKKDSPKYSNHLFRNDGNGHFTDVTETAGLAGTGYDIGVAIGDYDNDGYPDIFVAGVRHNTLYHNNRDGTFTDVTAKAGLDRSNDPQFGPLWSITAAWVDVNNDGLLDLFVLNYLQWKYDAKPLCSANGVADYCHPRFYKGTPNQLFLNKGDGTFQDVSEAWGIRAQVGKGMGVGVADYDLDGRPDLFVTNDGAYNFLFHNLGSKFEEAAFPAGVALPEDGQFVSGMGTDFRDYNNDGFPDIFFVALPKQTFPFFQNTGKGDFREVTAPSGLRALTLPMAGFGAGLYDLDNDGWKDIFVSRGHVASLPQPGQEVDQPNTVFRNPGLSGKWTALTEQAGLTASPPARHRGLAFGDLNGDGRIDVVVSALSRTPEIWMNRTPSAGHWLDIALEGTKSNRDGIGARIKLTSRNGVQYNHMTTSVGYASSSYGPVHFGLGPDTKVDAIEIRWPSGAVQTLKSVSADRVLKVKEAIQ